MANDASPFYSRTDHKARYIREKEQRNVECIAGVDKARAFVRRICEDDATFDTRLTGNDADRASSKTSKPGDQFLGEEFFDLKKAVSIHQRVNKIVHIEGLVLRFWHDIFQ